MTEDYRPLAHKVESAILEHALASGQAEPAAPTRPDAAYRLLP